MLVIIRPHGKNKYRSMDITKIEKKKNRIALTDKQQIGFLVDYRVHINVEAQMLKHSNLTEVNGMLANVFFL